MGHADADSSPSCMWSPALGMKALVRAQVKDILEKIPPELVAQQSAQITRLVLASKVYETSRSISCFLTIEKSSEVDTRELVRAILSSGRKLFVPRVNFVKKNRAFELLAQTGVGPVMKFRKDGTRESFMTMLRIYDMDDYLSLKKSNWGIPEPQEIGPRGPREDALDAVSKGLDLILMPGVAFDHNFSRLGHGKGYYDKWLARYADRFPSGSRPFLMALGLREQIVDDVPIEPHDWPLDYLVTPDGISPS